MTTYVELGPRTVVGLPDTTGNNKGNWTVTFDQSVLNTRMPYFEIYHAVIHGAAGSSMNWYVEQTLWESTVAADDNSWNPTQPLLMRAGQNVYMYWSDPVTDNTPPSVTIWLRYDRDIEANERAAAS